MLENVLHLLRILDENIPLFLLASSLFGAGIKYIDDAFDKRIFDKKKAILIAPLVGLLGMLIVGANQFSATLSLSVAIGVYSKKKIDNPVHLLSFSLIVIAFLLVFMVMDGEIMILPLIMLIAASLVDEAGNDISDYDKKLKKSKLFRHRFFVYFFGKRCTLKVVLLYMVLINIFPMYILVAIILFDETYTIVEMYSDSILNSKSDLGM